MSSQFITYVFLIPLCVTILSACDNRPSESAQQSTALLSVHTAEEQAYRTFLDGLAKNHVLLAYLQLEQASAVFSQTVRQTCAKTNETGQHWEVMQAKWINLNLKWQSIQWLRLGPINMSSLHSRLQYWPDANGAVERGVNQLIMRDTSPLLTQLRQMNVGSQGLPALELLLFSQSYQSVDKQLKRCDLLQVISTNITEMATKVLNEWQIYGDFYQQFVQGEGGFNGPKDTFEELVSDWVTQLTLIKDNKLLYPLGVSAPGIRGLTESPHADISGQNVHMNLLALKGALQGSKLDKLFIEVNGDTSISQRIHTELDKAIKISSAFSVIFSQEIAEKKGRERVRELIDTITRLQKLLSVDMVTALTLHIGFNSLDGD